VIIGQNKLGGFGFLASLKSAWRRIIKRVVIEYADGLVKFLSQTTKILLQLIVRILEEKGYSAGYQLGYPHNKVFIKVDVKEEADRFQA